MEDIIVRSIIPVVRTLKEGFKQNNDELKGDEKQIARSLVGRIGLRIIVGSKNADEVILGKENTKK